MTLFSNSNVKGIRQDLQQAKRSADSALNELQFSRQRLDSIKADMNVFKAYIDRIETTVTLNDEKKRLGEERDAKKRDSLQKEIQRHEAELATDTVPDIHIVSTH
jgi:chromosome segregation ATPase